MTNPEAQAPVETLRWRSQRLELIDQRVLPAQIECVACDSAASVAQAIRDMVVRGAPAIGCAAAYGVALARTEHVGVTAMTSPVAGCSTAKAMVPW